MKILFSVTNELSFPQHLWARGTAVFLRIVPQCHRKSRAYSKCMSSPDKPQHQRTKLALPQNFYSAFLQSFFLSEDENTERELKGKPHLYFALWLVDGIRSQPGWMELASWCLGWRRTHIVSTWAHDGLPTRAAPWQGTYGNITQSPTVLFCENGINNTASMHEPKLFRFEAGS